MFKTNRGILPYEMSTDYNYLWDRIQKGERFLGVVENDDLHDTVSIFVLYDRYLIGYRGRGYEGHIQTKENFTKICSRIGLRFVDAKSM